MTSMSTSNTTCLCQISTTITMLYYNMIAVYLKTTKFQLLTRRYFPVLALALFSLMTVMVLQPTLNIKSSRAEQWCQYVHSDIQSRSVVDILYIDNDNPPVATPAPAVP